MLKKIITSCSAIIIALTAIDAFADVKLGGSIKNDSIGTYIKNDFLYNDILEGKIIFIGRNKSKDWKFYADARASLYFGPIVRQVDYYDVRLMRAFMRYFSPIGDFTLGKTYINFGNMGLFNVFEFDKSVNINDLTYDKDGILALEYIFYASDNFEGKIYGGMHHITLTDYVSPSYSAGLCLTGHVGTFDLGFVANRLDTDRNLMGIFFKGDAEIGIQGAYAFHFNNKFNKYFNEVNFGIDYSFLDGHLIFNIMFYFNEEGATESGLYPTSRDYFFRARYYLYANITGVIDEFLSTQIDCFANAVDGSLLLMPSLNWTIINGLSMAFIFPIPIGRGDQEFSYDTSGYISFIIRVEGKF